MATGGCSHIDWPAGDWPAGQRITCLVLLMLSASLSACLQAPPRPSDDGGNRGRDASALDAEVGLDANTIPPDPLCTVLLRDDFPREAIDELTWDEYTSGSGSAMIGNGGNLVFSAGGADGTDYAEITSIAEWPVPYLQYTVSVAAIVPAGDPIPAVQLVSGEIEAYEIFVLDNKFSVEFAGAPSPCVECQTYVQSAHPFWRIRMTSDSAHFEAGNGNDWTPLGSVLASDQAVSAQVSLTAPAGSAGQFVIGQILVEECLPLK